MSVNVGNFQKELDDWLQDENFRSTPTISKIRKCKTEEEIMHVIEEHNYMKNIDWLSFYFENCKSLHRKTSDKTVLLRTEGNKLFQLKQYKESSTKYTESILHAPSGTENLAFAYGNRSAVLYHLSLYEECLIDIEQALGCQFPTSSMPKLLVRKAQCLCHLGKEDELVKCIEEARKAIKLSLSLDIKKKDALYSDLDLLKTESHSKISVLKESPLPVVCHGSNDVLLQASGALQLGYTDKKGRHLTTDSDIKPGDTLIVEKPFSAVLLPEHYLSHCHHCFCRMKVVYPCHQCTLVTYCSPECSVSSWKQYHHIECPYLQLLHSKVPGLDERGQYHRNYVTVYDLMSHLNDFSVEDLFQYALTAQLLLKVLKHSGWFQHSKNCNMTKETPIMTNYFDSVQNVHDDLGELPLRVLSLSEGETKTVSCYMNIANTSDELLEVTEDGYIGSLLLKHILQLVCNAHAITELQCSDVSNGSLVEEMNQVRIATAIYPTACLFNHSCDPTIISSFYKDTLVVRSVKFVSAGEEIFNCYGPHYRRMSWLERQHCLKEQYFFTCQCEPCMEGGKSEAIMFSYRCPQCSGPFNETAEKLHLCSQCGFQGLFDMNRVYKADTLFQEGLLCLQKHDVRGAIHSFNQCYTLRQAVLYKYHKNMSQVQDCLARSLAMSGNFKTAAIYLEESIEAIEVIFGKQSIEVANELQKLLEVLISAKNWQKAFKVANTALELFELHFGKLNDKVKEISSVKEELLQVVMAIRK